MALLATGLAPAAAPACSPAGLANALAPRAGYAVTSDLAYGNRPRQRLDRYLPDAGGPGTPLVVFFYGGRWQSGRKADFLFVAEAFVSQGSATAVPDIRLHPEVRFPVFLKDAAAAVAWLARVGGRHGLPPGSPVVLAGHSSGAHVVAMLALEDRWLAAAGAPRPAGLLGLTGPSDFLPLRDAHLRDIFKADTDRDALTLTKPTVHAVPPTLLLTGTDDATLPPGNSRRLAARLGARGAGPGIPSCRSHRHHCGTDGAAARQFGTGGPRRSILRPGPGPALPRAEPSRPECHRPGMGRPRGAGGACPAISCEAAPCPPAATKHDSQTKQ